MYLKQNFDFLGLASVIINHTNKLLIRPKDREQYTINHFLLTRKHRELLRYKRI